MTRADRIGFWVVLTAISGLLIENGTSSSPWLFFNPFGLLYVLPLYGLHVVLLTRALLAAPRPSLPMLYVAGALLGLYEAYVTKVLWSPTWGSTDGVVVGGLHVFQTAVLVLFAHPVLAFIAPLVIAEAHLVGPSGVIAGMPPRLAAALGSPRGRGWAAALLAFVLAAHHASPPDGPLVHGASALANTLVVAALIWWWHRRYAARPLPTLRDTLPGPRATIVLAGLLGLIYVASGVLIRPEGLPHQAGPHLVLAGIYAVLIAILARLIRRDSRSGPATHSELQPEPQLEPPSEPTSDPALKPASLAPHRDRGLLVFLVGYPLASAVLGLIPPVAAVIAVLTWAIAVPYGAWQLGRAAYLSVAPRRDVR
ncbi:MAG TPA: hypothetical protein DEH05_02850 [Propionibacteriaceae bacterium]|nr:hypothetical protein [Propionibacteriaceae bacterium]